MIHKFEAIRKDSYTRDNIYVFIDEAHRSVAKDLGTYLMASVPNATIIGFTGTPIAKTEQGEGTFKIFGAEDERGYLDKYSIARIDRGRDDAADQARHGAERDDCAGRAARQGVFRAGRRRGRHRHRGAEQGARSRRRAAHLPEGR